MGRRGYKNTWKKGQRGYKTLKSGEEERTKKGDRKRQKHEKGAEKGTNIKKERKEVQNIKKEWKKGQNIKKERKEVQKTRGYFWQESHITLGKITLVSRTSKAPRFGMQVENETLFSCPDPFYLA